MTVFDEFEKEDEGGGTTMPSACWPARVRDVSSYNRLGSRASNTAPQPHTHHNSSLDRFAIKLLLTSKFGEAKLRLLWGRDVTL